MLTSPRHRTPWAFRQFRAFSSVSSDVPWVISSATSVFGDRRRGSPYNATRGGRHRRRGRVAPGSTRPGRRLPRLPTAPPPLRPRGGSPRGARGLHTWPVSPPISCKKLFLVETIMVAANDHPFCLQLSIVKNFTFYPIHPSIHPSVRSFTHGLLK